MSNLLSSRARKIKESITMKITAIAKQLKANGEDVIGFGAGEPDFPTPEIVKQAGIQAIQTNKTTYTPAAGLLELREAVARYESDLTKQHFQASQVVISNGGKHAIMNCFLATLNSHDEVLIPSPYWVSYPEQVSITGAQVKIIETNDKSRFKLTPEALEKALSPKTKLLVLNSPSNPTGMLYNKSELKALAKILNQHNCFIMSDDIYAKLVYDNLDFESIASYIDNLDRLLLVSGASKVFAMTGWRIGYSITSVALAKAIGSLQSHMSGNPTSISQYAALAAFKDFPKDVISTMKQAFTKRRDNMLNELNNMPLISCLKPEGAFYAFPNISNAFGKISPQGNKITDSVSFCEHLLSEAKVACVPGAGFGADDYMRLSYATDDETIKKGLTRLKNWLEQLH